MNSVAKNCFSNTILARRLITIVLVVAVASLLGCGGPRVYTTDKTVVYQDNVYNVSNVRIFSPRSEAVLADGSTVNVKDVDQEAFEILLVANNGSIMVRQFFMLDSDEMLYQSGTVTTGKEFKKMSKDFGNAQEDLTKFLADKKKTQLKLK